MLDKEVEVQSTAFGIAADFVGPDNVYGGVLTKEIWDGIAIADPRAGLVDGCKQIMCELCRRKPQTTYDNFVGEFGDEYIEGYSRDGKRVLDIMRATME